MNDPPATLDRRPKGRHHLFIVAFSRFLYTHIDRPKEGGGEKEGAATGLCPLTPAKETGLPALPLPSPAALLPALPVMLWMVELSSLIRPLVSPAQRLLADPMGLCPPSHSQAFCGTEQSVPL